MAKRLAAQNKGFSTSGDISRNQVLSISNGRLFGFKPLAKPAAKGMFYPTG